MNAVLLFESEKSKGSRSFDFTIFTPSYNRKETIGRTYESILKLEPTGGALNGLS